MHAVPVHESAADGDCDDVCGVAEHALRADDGGSGLAGDHALKSAGEERVLRAGGRAANNEEEANGAVASVWNKDDECCGGNDKQGGAEVEHSFGNVAS